MTKIAQTASYNHGIIQKTYFDLGKDEFIASDLAVNFTMIEEFDKRIDAKKIKVVEKDTIKWIYNTLKQRLDIIS